VPEVSCLIVLVTATKVQSLGIKRSLGYRADFVGVCSCEKSKDRLFDLLDIST